MVGFYQFPPQGIFHVELGVHYHYKITYLLCFGCDFMRPPNISILFKINAERKKRKNTVMLIKPFSEKNIPKEVSNLELSFSVFLLFSPGLYLSLSTVFVKVI